MSSNGFAARAQAAGARNENAGSATSGGVQASGGQAAQGGNHNNTSGNK